MNERKCAHVFAGVYVSVWVCKSESESKLRRDHIQISCQEKKNTDSFEEKHTDLYMMSSCDKQTVMNYL